MAALTLAFLRPPSDDILMNRLTACASKHGICHVELVFEECVAFSIYHKGTPFLRKRSMANPGYEFVSLSVEPREYKAALQFCRSAVADGYAFDDLGLYLASVHPGLCMDKPTSTVGKTFCSKIITEALQFADVEEVQGLCPSAVTPSVLYGAVKNSERRVCYCVRPSKREAGVAAPLKMGQ
jgi:hypothetical protein